MENTKINQGGVYKNGCISPFEEKEQLTFIDFFAGIGGFRRGMELAGHKCVGFCEFDKYATASYTSMHLITEEQKEYLKTLPLKKRQKEILQEEYRNGEWYVSDIRDANVRNLPKADCWCFGAPCFVKGTLITTHRGLIPIEEIKTGDMVLTHKNRFKRVLMPMVNRKKGIWTLEVQGTPITEVTGNHRFYVRDVHIDRKSDKDTIFTVTISDPYWKEVRQFTGKELIQIPNDGTLQSNKNNFLFDYVLDNCLWKPIEHISYNPNRVETVYNMEVEDDHSYTANSMGVHNCQDFSIAGKRAGLDGDRSSLIREIFRLLEEQKEENRPEWLIYENVKGMLSSNRGLDYLSILSEMDRLGYDIEWQNINSKWFVPQNRERIYTIGHLRRFGRRKVLPVTGTDGENCVQQIDQLYGYEKEKNPSGGRVYSEKGICATLESGHGMSQPQVRVVCNTNPSGHGMNGNIYDSQAAAPALTTNKGEGSKISINIIGKINSSQDGLVHSINGISQCQSAGHGNCAKVAIPVIDVTHLDKTQNGRRLKENEDPMFTLTAQDRHGVVIEPIGGIYAFNSEKFGTPIYKDFVPTLKAEKHDTSVVLKTSIKKTNNDGIYTEIPGGFLTYCVWYEKYQRYIAIRKLTPKECFRLQGWSDEYFERAAFVNSDSQLYKQAGNGVTVDVVNAIGKQIYLSE